MQYYIVLLEMGNVVPADRRLLEVEEMQADESVLTGESQPVDKQEATLIEKPNWPWVIGLTYPLKAACSIIKFCP